MHYQRFVANPIREIKRLYEFLGQTLPGGVEAAMDVAISVHDERRAAVGPNRYSLEQFGLTADRLPPIFNDYVRQFGIEREA